MSDTDFQAVIDAARQGVPPIPVSPGALLHVQDGSTVSLESYLQAPVRKRGIVNVFDAASFNQVLRDNSDAGNAVVYIDRDVNAPRIEAVLNDCGKAGPGWRDFRAVLSFRPTSQWLKWKAIDGKLLAQADFAEFIEDNLVDVAEPVGGALLEIVTYLEATRTVDFKSAIRLSSGAIQFHNSESIDAKVSTGKVEVPEMFTLGIAPFLGSAPYSIPARFRYRLKEGKLVMGLKLQRVEDLMQKLIEDVVSQIDAGTDAAIVEGKAPEVVRA